MKKKILFILLMLVMFIPFVNVQAEDILGGEMLTTGINFEDSSLFMADDDVDFDRDIDGILFAAGNNLKIYGTSEYGFYAGNMIDVTGAISKDLFIAGNGVTLAKDAVIGRDVYIAANTVDIKTNISGKLSLYASKVNLSNITIEGNVYINSGTISFDNVKIIGKIKYNETATVTGIDTLEATTIEKYNSDVEIDVPTFGDKLQTKMISALSLLLIGIVINALFPNLYKKVSKDLTANRFFANVGWGLVFLIALPIAAILLLISVIGSGLGLISLGVYALCLGVAMLPASTLFGNLILTKLFKQKDNFYLAIIIGILALSLISLIPMVGGFINFLAVMFGLGLIFELMFTKQTKIKK